MEGPKFLGEEEEFHVKFNFMDVLKSSYFRLANRDLRADNWMFNMAWEHLVYTQCDLNICISSTYK